MSDPGDKLKAALESFNASQDALAAQLHRIDVAGSASVRAGASPQNDPAGIGPTSTETESGQ